MLKMPHYQKLPFGYDVVPPDIGFVYRHNLLNGHWFCPCVYKKFPYLALLVNVYSLPA